MASSNDNSNPPSTVKSYIDAAVGGVQSTIGSLTGSTADKSQGEHRRDEARSEYSSSHDVGKAGPLNMSSSGAVTADHQKRSEGSWNQTVGSGKEMLGNMVGAEGLKQEGIRQNQEGKGQEAEGQLSDLGHGTADRMKGRLGEAASGLTGDREGQRHYQEMHDQGKTKQRSVESDMQKSSEY